MSQLVRFFSFLVFFVSLMPISLVSAHEPEIVKGAVTIVPFPEISKAYYGVLNGQPHRFVIATTEPFSLYVDLLVPDIAGQHTDVMAVVIKRNNLNEPLAQLGGADASWNRFWEPFGRDWYLKGPAYKAHVDAGVYDVQVWSPRIGAKYSLAIGETELFGWKESVHALSVIPLLKRTYFNVSPAGFILSPIGLGYVAGMFVLSFVVGFVYRLILKNILRGEQKKLRVSKNIGVGDRAVRVGIGIALLMWGITTTWNPIVLFFSGFSFFEAMFSWCGVYAIVGRNTCDV